MSAVDVQDAPAYSGASHDSHYLSEGQEMYETPKLERLGTLREITRAGGCWATADGANPYHRYDPGNQSCPTT